MVSLHRPGIPRRSELLLTGAWLCADNPAPLPLPPPFLTHEHRTASLSLLSTSSHRAMAGDASPATTRATAPPCTAAAGFPSSLAHATGTIVFARGWGACWSPSPGRRPRRRRDLGGPPPPLFRVAARWGLPDVGAHLSVARCVCLCLDPGGSSNFEPGFSERIKEMIYRFCLNALEIHNLLKIAPNLLK